MNDFIMFTYVEVHKLQHGRCNININIELSYDCELVKAFGLNFVCQYCILND